jgi:ligand-binding SRPBCC domain-containing protein
MPKIKLHTEIKATKEIVFDLSRSIELHQISAEHTNETAIAGKTIGLIGMDESVTWRAKHFGIYQNLTSKITEFERPNYFTDEMIKGAFKQFRHEHYFADLKDGTLMTDIFDYQSPFGIMGRLFDKMVLEKYITDFLEKRNQMIKKIAESDQWRKLLKV